jgi:hypothetical protein
MQIASAIASSTNVHRVGNFAIGFFHEWIRAFLILTGAPRRDIFPPFTSVKESLLHRLLTKSGSAEISRMLHENDLLPGTVDYLCPDEVCKGRAQTDESNAKRSQSMMGRAHTDESNAKRSQTQKGRKRGPMSDETKAKLSKKMTGRKRGPMSDETKARLSKKMTGRKGSVKTDEERAKLSKKLMGRKMPF